jgi:glycerophosphoryl diester phosphodiesterase
MLNLTVKFNKLISHTVLAILCLLTMKANAQTFDWQGHRGARGLLPENSIPAFKKALDLGVGTIELDVVISKDKQVVVSHEPFFSSSICLQPNGEEISKNEEKQYNIYQYTYSQIKDFDCGSKGNARFPEQQKMKVAKPLLSEVFTILEKYGQEKNLPVFSYNIEIKCSPDGDNLYHPGVQEFSDLVEDVIRQHLPADRIILQSFDFRVLQYWHKKYPQYKLAALVENTKPVEVNLKELGFTPQIYSPYYKLLISKEQIGRIKNKGMAVIPWTVNATEDMRRLKSWGVDGIITDYPNRIGEL